MSAIGVSKADSNSTMSAGNGTGGSNVLPINRDSLSGAVIKDQSSSSVLGNGLQFNSTGGGVDQIHGSRHQQLMPPPPGSGAAAVAAAAAAAAAQLASQQSQHQQHDDLDSGLNSSSSSKEW